MDTNGTNSTNGTWTNGTTDGTFTPPPPKSFWTNLSLPTLYLVVLIGSLYTFSSLYRKRQLAKAAKLEPWFPPHKQRDIYLSLMHMDPAEASESAESEKQLKKVPDSILKAALLKRAVEDIQRIVQLRSSKPALQSLLQRGSVGDELWQRFQRAEQEMEAEVKDVVNEVSTQHMPDKETPMLTTRSGERLRTGLGPDHFPIRQRNQPEPHAEGAHSRDSITTRLGQGVVGEEAGRHPVRLHEGAGDRCPGS